MTDPAIRVQNLSKRYRIGAHEQAHDTLAGAAIDALKSPLANLRRLRRLTRFGANGQEPSDVIWALKDVSFEVQPGEVVGIIGRNGAGKSTLLKLLSRITHPTSGRIELNGRVSSLLEVGTGFHQELTGRENIYLNGTILGMRKAEIDRKFDEIVDFSGVEKFIDTPVKRYSSGMRVRLAFSVAAHLEPEILLIDEVLSVGDVAFQKKSLGKMEDVSRSGRTILFVSHNMGSVAKLCEKGMLFENGAIVGMGDMNSCISQYLVKGFASSHRQISDAITFVSPQLEIDTIRVNGQSEPQVHLAPNESNLEIEITGNLHQEMRLNIEARFYDIHGSPLGFFSPGHMRGQMDTFGLGNFKISRHITLPQITRGEYLVSLFLAEPRRAYHMKAPEAIRLVAQGATTATGGVIDYSKGNGWILLP